jgi:hypothetical protein
MMPPRQAHRVHAPLVVMLVAALGLGVAHGGGADLAPFVGDWQPKSDAQVSFICGADVPKTVPKNYGFAISPGSSSDLDLNVGCHCTLPLTIAGNRAELTTPTACTLLIDRTRVEATVTGVRVDLSSEEAAITIEGGPARAVARPFLFDSIDDCRFSISVIGRRSSVTPTNCGPDETAVGVIRYGADGGVDCQNGPGLEPVDVELYSYPDSRCLKETTGSHGEGQWQLPQADRCELTCNKTPVVPATTATATATVERSLVRLQLCRVDGRGFRPMTADASETDQSYAVLMLGSKCPNGSINVGWQLDTPDTNDATSCEGAAPKPSCGPNQGVTAGGASTFDLRFCLFRAGATADDVMPEFPDVGTPYAVFHDFTGDQPSWVMLKRWILSPQGSGNHMDASDEAGRQFSRIVEQNPDHGIYFNLARVR